MAIHVIKIYPGSETEDKFIKLLKDVNVKPDLIMCRLGSVFGTDYDEYILSDGLYRLIRDPLESMIMRWPSRNG